jgi:hypothetical protein
MVDRPMGCRDRSSRLIDLLSGSCVPTMGIELRTDGRHEPAQLHDTSRAAARARPAPAAAPTPRGLDRVGRKKIRRDSYSSPITSHLSPLAPLLRASRAAHLISPARRPLLGRSCGAARQLAIMMRVSTKSVKVHGGRKRWAEFTAPPV